MSKVEVLPEADIRQLALDGANLVPRDLQASSAEALIEKLAKLVNQLVNGVNHADVTVAHRTAACNLLSTLIERCALSPIAELRAWFWNSGIWMRSFDLFLDQHHHLNVKPSRQLMTALTLVLMKCDSSDIVVTTKQIVVTKLVGNLKDSTEHSRVRPSMQTLAHFLSKKFLLLQQCHVALHGDDVQQKEQSMSYALLEACLRWAPFDDFASSAGLLSSAILVSAKDLDSSITSSSQPGLMFHTHRAVSWVTIVVGLLAENPNSLNNFRYYVFPELFKHDLSDYIAFLEMFQLHQVFGATPTDAQALPSSKLDREFANEVLFCALSIGSRSGTVQIVEDAHNAMSLRGQALCISDTSLGQLLIRSSSTIRIASLSMLVSSASTSKPLSSGSLRALKQGIPYLHADSDSGFRSELFSLSNNLVGRLKSATSALAKLASSHVESPSKPQDDRSIAVDAAESLKAHRSFLEWYISFLKMELRPTASYQRHISAVRCISILQRSSMSSSVPGQARAKSGGIMTQWPFQISPVDATMIDLLLDLLFDPFDDVRQGSAEILSFAGTIDTFSSELISEPEDSNDTPRLVNILSKAEKLMVLSGRADQADGVAHLYSILFDGSMKMYADGSVWWRTKYGVLEHLIEALESTLAAAAKDISTAVSKHPLHGLFVCLRYIIQKPQFYQAVAGISGMNALYTRIFSTFRDTWSCVHDTLCNDAPEGYMPEEVEDEDDIDTKDLLSYCWRALKEASSLMKTIAKGCPITMGTGLMSEEDLRSLGDLSFTQLAELRHRGAFSTVAQTFAACCVRCSSIPDTGELILNDYYKRAILAIQNQTTINTRRSAGLPSLITGILVADELRGTLFKQAMLDLTSEATKPVSALDEQQGGLSQVHALNCLKDMLKNSKLGERSESHVPAALKMAATCLCSNTWAVRNSGLMLFRALLDRSLGTNETYEDDDTLARSRLSYAQVSDLMDIVLRLLSTPADTSGDTVTEGVFPALQLLQRAQPPSDKMKQVQDAVLRLVTSTHWHVRDKAARTYAALIHRTSRLQEAARLLVSVEKQQNVLHGVLLCCRYLINSGLTSASLDDQESFLHILVQKSMNVSDEHSCPFTRAAFVELRTTFQEGTTLGADRMLSSTMLQDTKELDHLLDSSRETFSAESSLRENLTNAVISAITRCAYSDREVTASIDTLFDLNVHDPDALVNSLKRISSSYREQGRITEPVALALTTLCLRLLTPANDAQIDLEVLDAVQDVLLALIDSEHGNAVLAMLQPRYSIITEASRDTTPSIANKHLVLQGAILGVSADGNDNNGNGNEYAKQVETWLVALEAALHEDNPYDARLAAAEAIRHFASILRSSLRSRSFLMYCIAVYDLTNDDDDDIRNIAAHTVCAILATADQTSKREAVVPLAAGVQMLSFLSKEYKGDMHLADVALQRIVQSTTALATMPSLKQTMEELSKYDDALFVKEKQNLFIDEAREAQVWSQLIMRLSPNAVALGKLQALIEWTLDGLVALTARSKEEIDGPLGWTRKPDMYVLGLRVIYAAEVVLALCGKKEGMHVFGSVIRAKLVELMTVGKTRQLNSLWLDQIEKVLERSIKRGVVRIGSVVSPLADILH